MTTEQELELKKRKKQELLDSLKANEQIQTTRKEIIRLWEEREHHEISLREKIRTLAYQIAEAGIPEGFVSTTIILMFKANKSLSDYINHTLEQRYKRKYTKPEIASGDANTIEECSITADQIVEVLTLLKTLTPEDLGRGEYQDIAQLLHENKNRAEKQADEFDIPLSYIKNSLGDVEDDEKESQEDSPLSDDEIILAFQEFFGESELVGLRDDFNKLAESVLEHNYIPWDKELLEDGSLSWHAFRSLMRPLLDKKWQRDWGEWCDILENYHDQGGTYASSKSSVEVADLKNEKTGESQRRKITKEQIDATHDEYLNEMRFIISNLRIGGKFGSDSETGNQLDKINPKTKRVIKYTFTHEQLKPQDEGFNPTVRSILDEMRETIEQYRPISFLFKFYRENERGFRAKRAVNLGPKLSDKA